MKLFRDLRLFFRAYPIAKGRVIAHSESKYNGVVRTQIAYNEVRTALVNDGIANNDITGAIVYLAISLAYLLNK